MNRKESLGSFGSAEWSLSFKFVVPPHHQAQSNYGTNTDQGTSLRRDAEMVTRPSQLCMFLAYIILRPGAQTNQKRYQSFSYFEANEQFPRHIVPSCRPSCGYAAGPRVAQTQPRMMRLFLPFRRSNVVQAGGRRNISQIAPKQPDRPRRNRRQSPGESFLGVFERCRPESSHPR